MKLKPANITNLSNTMMQEAPKAEADKAKCLVTSKKNFYLIQPVINRCGFAELKVPSLYSMIFSFFFFQWYLVLTICPSFYFNQHFTFEVDCSKDQRFCSVFPLCNGPFQVLPNVLAEHIWKVTRTFTKTEEEQLL